MKSSNLRDRVLVRLLSTLGTSDRKGLASYLDCALFNRDQGLLRIYKLLEKRVLNSRKPEVLVQDFAMESGTPIERLNKSFSVLFQHTNQYLELTERRRRPLENFRYLFHAYERLGVDDTIKQKEFRRALKQIQQAPLEPDHLHLEFFIAHQMGTQVVYKARNRNIEFVDQNLNLLDQFHGLAKLKYLCASYNLSTIFDREYRQNKDHFFIQWCHEHTENLPPLGLAYWQVLQSYLYPGQELELLQQLRKLMVEESSNFPSEDVRDLYGYLLNKCIPKVEIAEESYEVLLDDTYQELLKNGGLLDEGKLSPFHFKNIVNLRLRQGEVQWVRNFIDQFREQLTRDFDGQVQALAEAMLSYYAGQKREAIAILKTLIAGGSPDLFIGLDARNMLWRSYVDLLHDLSAPEYEEMHKLYDSFRLFVSRNVSISTPFKKSFQNFIRLYNKLISIREKGEFCAGTLQNLKYEVKGTTNILNKKWFLSQIEGASQNN